jgi:hypothetical protein
MRLGGADPILGVEMVSTGEVACIGNDLSDALLKALEASEFTIPPRQGSILITVGTQAKENIVQVGKRFEDSGFRIFATEHTADALRKGGLHDVTVLNKIRDQKEPNVLTYLLKKEIDLVINIPSIKEMAEGIAKTAAATGGCNYKPGKLWYPHTILKSPVYRETLLSIKKAIDPQNIMNPGALTLPSD